MSLARWDPCVEMFGPGPSRVSTGPSLAQHAPTARAAYGGWGRAAADWTPARRVDQKRERREPARLNRFPERASRATPLVRPTKKAGPGRGYSAAPLVTGHGVGEQCSIGSPGDNRDDDRRRTRSSPSEWSDTGARASGSGGRGCALACIDVSCARACVYVFGPAVTSSGGASRAPGTPSYLVGFARCYLLRELVVG